MVARRLAEAGLEPAHDAVGNVLARVGGPGPALVVAAHLDTVFPATTPLAPRRDDDVLRGPGIGDNAIALAALVYLAAALGGRTRACRCCWRPRSARRAGRPPRHAAAPGRRGGRSRRGGRGTRPRLAGHGWRRVGAVRGDLPRAGRSLVGRPWARRARSTRCSPPDRPPSRLPARSPSTWAWCRGYVGQHHRRRGPARDRPARRGRRGAGGRRATGRGRAASRAPTASRSTSTRSAGAAAGRWRDTIRCSAPPAQAARPSDCHRPRRSRPPPMPTPPTAVASPPSPSG
jgi:hypothetical protein